MIIKKIWVTFGVVTLLSPGVFVLRWLLPSMGPGRHGPDSGPAYDSQSEVTLNGTVADVKSGRSAWSWLSQIHTLGLGHKRIQEKQLLLKTDMGTIQIHLGPTAFLSEKKVEIRKGDTVEATGSRVAMGESQVVLAREIRKGNYAWPLRDATGQPLWSSMQTKTRDFWTTKKVLLTVVVIKVVALAAQLGH